MGNRFPVPVQAMGLNLDSIPLLRFEWDKNDSLDVFSSVYESATDYWVQSNYDIDYEGVTGEAESIYTDVWVDPVNGWDTDLGLGKPDHVITLPEFDVPAEGRVPYRYVRVKNDFKENKWVRAAEFVSNTPGLVHHTLTFLDRPRWGRREANEPWISFAKFISFASPVSLLGSTSTSSLLIGFELTVKK